MKAFKQHIVEKLKISKDKYSKKNKVLGDIFDAKFEASPTLWKAFTFYESIKWNELNDYLDNYPEFRTEYGSVYKPSPDTQYYIDHLNEFIGFILTIPCDNLDVSTMSDDTLWEVIYDYIHSNIDFIELLRLTLIVREDNRGQFRIKIYDRDDNGEITFYLMLK